MTKAADLCQKAADLVGGDREESHGPKERNYENVARLWQAYLEVRRDPMAPLDSLDTLHMMVLLKVARTQLGSFNLDDYVDMVGYGACGGEVAAAQSYEQTIPRIYGVDKTDLNPVSPPVPRRNDDGS